MSCCQKKADTREKPSCCKKGAGASADVPSSWTPNASSSPQGSTEDLQQEESPLGTLLDINDISPIVSDEGPIDDVVPSCCKSKTGAQGQVKPQDPEISYAPLPPAKGRYFASKSFVEQAQPENLEFQEILPPCCKSKTRAPAQGKPQDPEISYSPLPPATGTYFASKSFIEQAKPQNWKFQESFHIPRNIEQRNLPSAAYRRDMGVHVPRPSRNYATFESSEPIIEGPTYRRSQPRYLSNRYPASSIGENRQGTLWNQSTNASYNLQQSPADESFGSYYASRSMAQRTRPQSAQMNSTFLPNAQMNATFQRPQSAQSRFVYPPHSTPTSYPQRFASPQMISTRAQDMSAYGMNASYAERPQTLQGVTQRPTSAQPQLPSGYQADRFRGQRPQTAEATFFNPEVTLPQQFPDEYYSNDQLQSPPEKQICTDNTCDRRVNVPKASCQPGKSFGAAPTDALAVYQQQPPASLGQAVFDTLLEIRAPRRSSSSPYLGSPLQLSINVSCADQSIVVTPDKRYNVVYNTPQN